MNKFFTIFKFEFKEYLRNKGLIISALIVAIVIVFLSFLPKIISAFSSGDDGGSKKHQTIYALVLTDNLRENGFADVVQNEFGVDIKIVENTAESIEALKGEIQNKTIEKAFAFTSDTSYNYIINNAGRQDWTTSTFDTILKKFLQKLQLADMGLNSSEVENFFDMQITSTPIILGKHEGVSYGIASALNVIIYMVIITFSSVLSYNIITEKTSKTVEVLITSTSTTNLLFGKVFALLAFIILEGLFLGLVAFLSFRNVEGASDIAGVLFNTIGTQNLIYILIFLLLGVALYLFFITIFSAQINRLEDAGSASLPTIILIIIPYFLVFSVHDTEQLFFKILSFIPFFSPILMPTRFLHNVIPAYEIWGAVIILAGSAILVGYLASKLYRRGILNTGNKGGKILSALSFLRNKK
ncbi:MAG: ABC transporter permease [Treponemataceae bacterium]